LVLGVFSGSAIWWLVLCQSVSLLRDKLTPKRLRWIDRFSGIVIAGLGIIVLSSLVFQLCGVYDVQFELACKALENVVMGDDSPCVL
jgi:hypothetical protein